MGDVFITDGLAYVLLALVGSIGFVIWFFARRYMRGDRRYTVFMRLIPLLYGCVSVGIFANYFLLYLLAWAAANGILVYLMMHDPQWKASQQSAKWAFRNFGVSLSFIALSFFIFWYLTHAWGIGSALKALQGNHHTLVWVALVLLILGALSQSAVYPFHRWLISSVNAPTPVSAMMHAGLVNGGGFVLIRFSPLLKEYPLLLNLLFIVGMGTALMGTLWELIEHDNKRMIACSTVSQMGFMVAQCGMGLFGFALVHMVWHGLFKAYLFLVSGSVARDRRVTPFKFGRVSAFLALCVGFWGSFVFAFASQRIWGSPYTDTLMMMIVGVACAQFSLELLENHPIKYLPKTLFLTALVSGLYGVFANSIHALPEVKRLDVPILLNGVYVLGAGLLMVMWALMASRHWWQHKRPHFFAKAYVAALNKAQPYPDTVTTSHLDYPWKDVL